MANYGGAHELFRAVIPGLVRKESEEECPRNTRKDTRAKRRKIARETREKTRKGEGKGMFDKLGSLATVEGRC